MVVTSDYEDLVTVWSKREKAELTLFGRITLSCELKVTKADNITILVEGIFPDGTKLITVHDPVSRENGDLDLALHGSFLPIPSLEKFPIIEDGKIPGELILRNGCILLNSGWEAVILKVLTMDIDQYRLAAIIILLSHGIIVDGSPLAYKTTREAYANIYGPTVGDKIRLGNPDAMNGVFSNMIIGVSTEVIAREGKIVTAGTIDHH
nr:amidohydrolase 1 [Tanacetum cinerariifolium]